MDHKYQTIAMSIMENLRYRGDNTPQNVSILTTMAKFVELGRFVENVDDYVVRFMESPDTTSRLGSTMPPHLRADAVSGWDNIIDQYVSDNDVDTDNTDHVEKMIKALLGQEIDFTHKDTGGESTGGDKPEAPKSAGEKTREALSKAQAQDPLDLSGGEATGDGGGGGGEDRPVMHSELPDILKAEAEKTDVKLLKVADVARKADMQIMDAVGTLTGELSELEAKFNKFTELQRTEVGDQLEEFKTKLQEQARTKTPMVIMTRGRKVHLDADEVEQYHHIAVHVFTGIAAGVNIALIGPAGCGKTKLCSQIAEKLGLPFHFTGALDSPYKLTGFRTADGNVVRTPFREAFEHGGLFLLDEIDGSDPGVLLTLNAALANDVMDFPDKIVTRHRDFYAVAAANTFWNGRDREYVGRNQLDGSTVDRFMFIEMGYDLALESRIAPVKSWARVVQAYRKAAEVSKTRHIVSQRATIDGGKLLLSGMSIENVLKFVLFKGLPEATIARLEETATREAGGRLAGLIKAVPQEVAGMVAAEPVPMAAE